MSILDTPDDFELCDRVFNTLSEQAIDVDRCDEMERVVRLVWDSSGLIGNGGLHRLFEGDYKGDPGFVYTVAAYHRIGAVSAHKALQSAFRQFPAGVLPEDVKERLRIFDSVPSDTWREIKARYYDADKGTERCRAAVSFRRRGEYASRRSKLPIQ